MPQNYISGISITGIVDPKGETYRVKLDVGRWDEPDWGAEDNVCSHPPSLSPRYLCMHAGYARIPPNQALIFILA
jgi:hypothetical protein